MIISDGGLSTGGLDLFCAADVHAGAHQAARDALHRRAGMFRTLTCLTNGINKNYPRYVSSCLSDVALPHLSHESIKLAQTLIPIKVTGKLALPFRAALLSKCFFYIETILTKEDIHSFR